MELSLLIDILQTGDQDAVQKALLEFNREYAQSFFFNAEEREKRKREKLEEFRKMKRKEHFSNSDSDSDSDHSNDPEVKLREKIGELLIDSLSWELQPCCRLVILEAIRILSRDKHGLAPFARTDSMRLLARLAGLEATEEGGLLPEASDGEVACEALKCLCNTIYNSEEAQGMAAEEVRLIGGLARCLKADGGAPESGRRGITRFYELRLTFLLTALRLDIRRQLAHQFHGVALLADALETTLGLRWLDVHEVATSRSGEPLPRDVTERAMEILKILFNITFETSKQQVDEARIPLSRKEDAALYRHLAAILRYCLLTDSDSKEWTQEFHGHTVNVLVNLPLMCLDVLLMPKVEPGSVEYMGMNMDTVEALLDFMNRRLDRGLKLRESLTPVLNLLTESSRYHRETRKFLRARVLPPLRDVTNRPEVGEALRNKLVRLMTHVNTDVKHCAAEFLFVLCKENVSRFVKYTGYGNAAGLLAARGLLGGGKGDGKYSEEEDTDTEEYKEAKPNINPVTGRVEEKLPNPMDGMTDEQKEYEAMKLVSMFDRLSREQIIQPMGVGCDGKLTPLDETVQQMAEQISFHSDSDMELD